MKATTYDTNRSSFFDLYLEYDVLIRVKINNNRADLNFKILMFPLLCGNHQSPSYEVNNSQLIRSYSLSI